MNCRNHHARAASHYDKVSTLKIIREADSRRELPRSGKVAVTCPSSLMPVLSVPSGRAKLNEWLFTLPDPVPGAGIILPLLLENLKSKTSGQHIRDHWSKCGYEIRWALFSGHASIGHR